MLVNESPVVEWRIVCDVTTCSFTQTKFNVRLLDFALGAPRDRVCGVLSHVPTLARHNLQLIPKSPRCAVGLPQVVVVVVAVEVRS